jgi:hypothetical protein
MTWKNNTLENLELARNIARELASIVAIGQQKYIGQVEQGYGNYGTCRFTATTTSLYIYITQWGLE